MTYSVYWTPEAERTFNHNIEFLAENWTESSIDKFVNRVDEVVQLISHNPEKYQYHRRPDQVRKCVVNKHITLFFKIAGNRIDLLTFWNTHQDPEKLDF